MSKNYLGRGKKIWLGEGEHNVNYNCSILVLDQTKVKKKEKRKHCRAQKRCIRSRGQNSEIYTESKCVGAARLVMQRLFLDVLSYLI